MNVTPLHAVEDSILDLDKTFAEAIKNLDPNVGLNEVMVNSVNDEIERLQNAPDELSVLTEKQVDDIMAVLAAGKPIITADILHTLQRTVEKPGVTVLQHRIVGADRKPFRGKAICYLVRVAEGEEVLVRKEMRKPGQKKTTRIPFTERFKLFTLSDNFARGPQDQRWLDVITRFSAAYTVLNNMVEQLQSHKIMDPNNLPDGLAEILHGEGDSEAEATKVVS